MVAVVPPSALLLSLPSLSCLESQTHSTPQRQGSWKAEPGKWGGWFLARKVWGPLNLREPLHADVGGLVEIEEGMSAELPHTGPSLSKLAPPLLTR